MRTNPTNSSKTRAPSPKRLAAGLRRTLAIAVVATAAGAAPAAAAGGWELPLQLSQDPASGTVTANTAMKCTPSKYGTYKFLSAMLRDGVTTEVGFHARIERGQKGSLRRVRILAGDASLFPSTQELLGRSFTRLSGTARPVLELVDSTTGAVSAARAFNPRRIDC